MVSSVLKNLYRDHANLDELLKLIEEEIERIGAGGPDPQFETLTLALEYCVDYPGHFHHPTEDLVYAMLVRRAPTLVPKIVVITADHKTLARLTRSFSDAVANAIETGGTKQLIAHGREFLRHYRDHMHIEETEIFPAAEKNLTQDDWSEIEEMAKVPSDPLFTDHVREAYQALNHRIVARAKQSRKDRTEQE